MALPFNKVIQSDKRGGEDENTGQFASCAQAQGLQQRNSATTSHFN
jgi:hypothetical protein